MKAKRAMQQPVPQPTPMSLTLRNPESLQSEVEEMQLAVARRAYELFEARGCEHGHDWEDWFRAESELLRPVMISIFESEDRISVRANVLGFEEKELRISVEPRHITILGKKGISVTESEGGKVEYIDWYPDQILKRIELAADVIPESSVVELQAGLLRLDLVKAAGRKAKSANAA